jgi:hypothetical protein
MALLLTAVSAVLLPAAVAAVVVALGRVLGKRSGTAEASPWWTASAVGLAYLAGHLAVARPSIPPIDVTDRIPFLALAAAVVAAVEAAAKPGPRVRAAVRFVLVALALGLILGPVIGAGDIPREVVVWLSASVAVALVAWIDLEALIARPRGADVLRALILTSGGASVALMIAESAVLCLLAAALTAALTAAWVVARGAFHQGHLSTAVAVLTALVLEGFVYATLPATSAALLAAAPAATWVTRLGPLRRLGPWSSATLGAVAVLVPIGLAAWLAVSPSPSYP